MNNKVSSALTYWKLAASRQRDTWWVRNSLQGVRTARSMRAATIAASSSCLVVAAVVEVAVAMEVAALVLLMKDAAVALVGLSVMVIIKYSTV